MASKMHTDWLSAKAELEKEIKAYKDGRSNQLPTILEEKLKSFNQGFGPKLDDVAKAYKAKNDAEIKKQADKALTIANTYKKTLGQGVTAAHAVACQAAVKKLDTLIIPKLTALKANGSKAADPS